MLEVTPLRPEDPLLTAEAFAENGWDKPEAQYLRQPSGATRDQSPA